MAAHINVIQRYKDTILENGLNENSLINKCISFEIIDKQLYHEIWNQQNRLAFIFEVLFKDARRCAKFIKILELFPNLRQIVNVINKEIQDITNVTIFGEFPQFPDNYVIRNSIARELKDSILNLQVQDVLVVYGLPGYGKSSLVSQVLQDKCFLDRSNGVMIWINLGEHKDASNLLKPLKELYSLAVSLLDLRREDFNEIVDLRNALKKLFIETKLKTAFLILDDVKSREVLNVFSLGCRLIVIAQEKMNLSSRHVQMNHGFKKLESLQLFKIALNTTNLSNQMKYIEEIHQQCNGCPMSINLIGSILKSSREFALSNRTDIWESIIQDLKQDKTYLDRQMFLIKRNVDSLTRETLVYFHSLAIFPKHANVSHELLMRLWKQSNRTVRRIMTELENKSFVSCLYPKDHETYIYCIHSLIFTYLNESQYTISVVDYHRKMLETIDDVINFKEDEKVSNYVLAYFGHHARHGKVPQKFDYYFNLNFIERKIRRVGSADVIADFETYKDDIVRNDPVLERKLEDYKSLVAAFSAYLHILPEIDIVEFAITSSLDPKNMAVREAMKIASHNFQFCFKIQPYSENSVFGQCLSTNNIITAVSFINPDEIIIGTSCGSIEIGVFNHYDNKVHKFVGHYDEIFSLILSPEKSMFLSLSRDNTAKLWKLSKKFDFQSPKCKQNNYVNLHGQDSLENSLLFNIDGGVISGDFSLDNEMIVVGSSGGVVSSLDIKQKKLTERFTVGFAITAVKIAKFEDEDIVILCYDKKINLFKKSNFHHYRQFVKKDLSGPYNFLFEDNSLYAITDKQIQMWPCAKILNNEEFSAEISCVAVNEDYIFLGTREDFIYLYSRKSENSYLGKLKTDYGVPIAICVVGSDAISIEVRGNTLQRRKIHLNSKDVPKVRDLNVFSCHWKDSIPIYSIVNENKLYIYSGASALSIKDNVNCNLKLASFSACGNSLIYISDAGVVNYYNYKNKRTFTPNLDLDSTTLIKCFRYETLRNLNLNPFVDGNVCGIVSDSRVIIDFNPIDVDGKTHIVTSGKICDFSFDGDNLITVDTDCKVVIASLSSTVLCDWFENGLKFVGMDVNHDRNCIAMIVSHEAKLCYYLILLKYSLRDLVFEKSFRVKLETLPKVVRFSFNGKLLAVGYDDGNIEIFDVEKRIENNSCKSVILDFHKQPVEEIIFEKSEKPVLISIANQIAYWELTDLHENEKDLLKDSSNCDVQSTEIKDSKSYLKAKKSFSKQLKYISASKDFRSFLTVDSDGNIYKIDLIATCD